MGVRGIELSSSGLPASSFNPLDLVLNAAEDGLEFLTFLPLPSKYRDNRYSPPQLTPFLFILQTYFHYLGVRCVPMPMAATRGRWVLWICSECWEPNSGFLEDQAFNL